MPSQDKTDSDALDDMLAAEMEGGRPLYNAPVDPPEAPPAAPDKPMGEITKPSEPTGKDFGL